LAPHELAFTIGIEHERRNRGQQWLGRAKFAGALELDLRAAITTLEPDRRDADAAGV
jgi:hypothetical protein